jgi:hypothetical protein
LLMFATMWKTTEGFTFASLHAIVLAGKLLR